MAHHGHGLTLKGTTLLSGSAIGSVTSVGVSGISVDDLDVSTLASDDKFKEFISGMIDGGEITFEGRFSGTDIGAIYAALGVSDTFIVTYSDTGAATWTATGYLKSLDIDNPYDSDTTYSCSIKVSGKPTYEA